MSLSLVGNHDLDRLEEMAMLNFSEVENRKLILPDVTNEQMFDEATGYGHIYKIVPLKDVKELSIKFPNLPDQRGNWSTKSLSYLSHVLGHEGKNSLTSELIKQDLAMGVSVGPEMRVMG